MRPSTTRTWLCPLASSADLSRQTYIIELDWPPGVTDAAGRHDPARPCLPPQPLRFGLASHAGSSTVQAGPHQGAPGDIVAPMQAIVVALAVSSDQVGGGS